MLPRTPLCGVNPFLNPPMNSLPAFLKPSLNPLVGVPSLPGSFEFPNNSCFRRLTNVSSLPSSVNPSALKRSPRACCCNSLPISPSCPGPPLSLLAIIFDARSLMSLSDFLNSSTVLNCNFVIASNVSSMSFLSWDSIVRITSDVFLSID